MKRRVVLLVLLMLLIPTAVSFLSKSSLRAMRELEDATMSSGPVEMRAYLERYLAVGAAKQKEEATKIISQARAGQLTYADMSGYVLRLSSQEARLYAQKRGLLGVVLGLLLGATGAWCIWPREPA